ncbi:hypothetical protein BMF94_3859 [Rhodotorula taiwanensis]|uniref:Small ribosomal subunit protein mS41 n=1 Tax=Rhodotorula taiwanensis TaxID=741276 RepID=A0A2S5B8H3_9BASI|nr:hypothetical protein BMF94_3859 [Rhodotorula taiwanensis]
MQRTLSSCTCLRAGSAAARPFAAPSSAFISQRAIHAPAAVDATKRVPKPRGPYVDPAALLSVSKRGLESYAEKLGTWPELFTKTSGELREAGMDVKETRYTLWLLEKYRQGHDPAKVAVAPTPKKTIRGWGPKVQNGKRVR